MKQINTGKTRYRKQHANRSAFIKQIKHILSVIWSNINGKNWCFFGWKCEMKILLFFGDFSVQWFSFVFEETWSVWWWILLIDLCMSDSWKFGESMAHTSSIYCSAKLDNFSLFVHYAYLPFFLPSCLRLTWPPKSSWTRFNFNAILGSIVHQKSKSSTNLLNTRYNLLPSLFKKMLTLPPFSCSIFRAKIFIV